MIKSLVWADVGNGVLVSNEVRVDLSGGMSTRTFLVSFRVDSRNVEREGHRVDRLGMLGWEAIDGGGGDRRGVETIEAGQAHAKAYLIAMQEQGTHTPRMPRD